jgi:hypothetical protein
MSLFPAGTIPTSYMLGVVDGGWPAPAFSLVALRYHTPTYR